ncbi:MAG: cyclase family protein [Steroidobacteraceae bacterium]
MRGILRIDGGEASVDLDDPVSLAIPVDFAPSGPRYFGAPQASSRALTTPGFAGSVAAGASCNCRTITLTPHGNGTHTECAGHLTREPLDAFRVVPAGLLPARLATVAPERAASASETSDPPPAPDDRLITRRGLAAAVCSSATPPAGSLPRALVIRTTPATKPAAAPAAAPESEPPPYLSREAAEWLVERSIEHLVVDVPSIDRARDEGRLTAHRIFFGLPPGAADLALARRARCTVTELASIPAALPDGEYLLELQVPAIAGDAVPSRPLLYALQRLEP